MHGVVGDLGPQSHGVDRIAREHAAAGEQPTGLPVRQAELGLVEGELPIDPAGEAVADEWSVDRADRTTAARQGRR